MVDDHLAIQLADFVNSLRRIDTLGLRPQGSLHSCRADPIERRDSATRASIAACGDLLNGALTEAAWEKARQVIDYAGPVVWMHSDLHPGNILVSDRSLSAVIDWGGLALGDPAIDCLIALTLLTPSTRHTFRLHVDVDEGTWTRGRAWLCRLHWLPCRTTATRTSRSRPGRNMRLLRSLTTSALNPETTCAVSGFATILGNRAERVYGLCPRRSATDQPIALRSPYTVRPSRMVASTVMSASLVGSTSRGFADSTTRSA